VVKEIIGACVSSGIKVEDKPAKELYSDISTGKYDELFK
jgi:large subunit ribosomal protein L11